MRQKENPVKIQKGFSIAPVDPDAKLAKQKEQLRGAAEMYETYFLNHMVKSMRSTVDRESGINKPNFAEKIFSEQLDGKYVDGWAKKGGIGLADMIFEQINQRIESARHRPGGPSGPLPLPQPEVKGAIPLEPATGDSIRMKALPAEGKSAEYRFEVMGQGESTANAPIAGKVLETRSMEEGWKSVRLDHGQGLTSELTFPGTSAELRAGTEVQVGQKLGNLDSRRPALAWKLEWS